MDSLPDQLVCEILDRVNLPTDRNALSSTCKRLYKLDNEERQSLCIGCGLNPANECLTSLCNRFPNLRKVEIVYSGWMSKLGKQLDDQGLLILAKNCPLLKELSLSYCTVITDLGLGHLTSLNLSSLKLKFTPRVTGCGIFALVVGCRKLTQLHLIRCLNITSAEWLECLGRQGNLEELLIKNCRAIGEGDLMNLGQSWRKLKLLQFEVDTNYRYMKVYDRLSLEKWQEQPFPCESMVELRLVNCIISPGKGLACVLGRCGSLERVHLDMCLGLRDHDIISLAQNSRSLRSISLRMPSDFTLPLMNNNATRLTDASLKALATNCSLLESVKISFSDGEFPPLSSFSLEGILTLLTTCPIRELSLDQVYSFNDVAMEALCSVCSLETLELVRCQEISDDGISLVSQVPRLRVLHLEKCLGVTDYGLWPLVGMDKLELIVVEDCPKVSERGVIGTAKSVSYKQDLSWLH